MAQGDDEHVVAGAVVFHGLDIDGSRQVVVMMMMMMIISMLLLRWKLFLS